MSDLLEKFVVSAPPEMWRDVHVGVALSGGPDSVALLRATIELKQRTGGRGDLFALHINHKLRGAESDADAVWCETQCRKLGIALQVREGNVMARAAAAGDGLEAAARDERYQLLIEMAEECGMRYLFFGHTRDDQVETVLFRILRGTGLRGLAGIAATRLLTPALTLVRPLLSSTRAEVIAYLDKRGQDYRFDSSNRSGEFARNRIRAELLPLLRANYSSEIDEALLGLAEQAGEAQVHIEAQAREVLAAACEWATHLSYALSTEVLRRYSPLLVSEALRLAWREAGFPEQAMTREWWTKLADLTHEDASNIVLNLPGNVRVELAGGVLVVERAAEASRQRS